MSGRGQPYCPSSKKDRKSGERVAYEVPVLAAIEYLQAILTIPGVHGALCSSARTPLFPFRTIGRQQLKETPSYDQ